MPGLPLYYMAPLQPNAVLIALLGVFSFNQLHAVPEIADLTRSIADPFVNGRRHGIPIGSGTLHDFVPLYWAIHTPMQYVVTQRPGVFPQDELVFVVFDSTDILAIPSIWTTDGNAASNDTTPYVGVGALPYLDWKVLETPDCWSREYKRRKCAEVLVPDQIPASAISEIRVYSDVARRRLTSKLLAARRQLAASNLTLPLTIPPVIVDASLFY